MLISTALVVTSIASSDHPILRAYAAHCSDAGIPFLLIGDRASPVDFRLEGCEFYSLQRQRELDFTIVGLLPEKHYARKNIGYLLAREMGVATIIETDDDNHARNEFWQPRESRVQSRAVCDAGWINVYGYFTAERIWPRGFDLDSLKNPLPTLEPISEQDVYCPIQQGLADENPDVDAIYRLILPLPFNFEHGRSVALGRGTWCPFNSQNTTWFRDAFELMYLPSYCSFRMTDIWRSFVAQRIAWENGWHVLFHSATVYQERNAHNLMRDFSDEISGYQNNGRIAEVLGALDIAAGKKSIGANLLKCYEALVRLGVIDKREIPLVEAWLRDCST